MEDRQGKIWISSRDEGIAIYDKKKNSLDYITADCEIKNKRITSNSITTIFEDKFGNIWLGSEKNGLNKYDRDNDSIIHYKAAAGDTKSISSNLIFCFYHDSDNVLWVGTGMGINKFDYKTGEFSHYTEEDNLVNNSVFFIQEDESGNLWISTAEGISKFDRKNSFTNYVQRSGLQSNEFIERSGCRTPDGKLYFGGINGFNAFMPAEIKENTYSPDVVITNFRLQNNIISIEEEIDGAILLNESITFLDKLTLNHNQNYFSFDFAVLNFSNPEENRYLYILEGYDEEWQSLQDRNTAYYTNVSPGDYVLRVRGANSYGTLGEKEAALNLKIIPPFWSTFWFKFMTGIFILGMVYVVYKQRVNRIEQINIKLENEVALRTEQLQKINNELEKEIETKRKNEEEIQKNLTELEKNKKVIEANSNELKKINEKLSESEAELKTLNASKDKFFSIIAHDLRNPFTTLLGVTRMLYEEFHDFSKEEIKQSVMAIYRMSDVVYNLLDNLLKWSSIHTGRMLCTPELFNVYELAYQPINLLKDTAEKKEISIINNLNHEAEIYADPKMIDAVLRNLISNSIKFTPAGGSINLFSVTNKDFIEIIVEDNGVGIEEKIIDNLFKIDIHHSTT